MSITPLPTGPSLAPGTATGEAGTSGEPVDGTFAALVAGLLGEGQSAPTVPATAEGVVVLPVAGEAAPAEPAAAEDPASAEGDQAVASVPTPLWQQIAGQLAATPATVPTAVAPTDPEGAAGAVAPVSGAAPAAGGAVGAQEAVSVPAAAAAAAVADVAPASSAGPSAGQADTPGAVTSDVAASASGDAAHGQAGNQPSDQGSASPRPSTEAGQITAAGGTTSATAPAAAPSATSTTSPDARPMPVVSQLAPEVTRLVSRGDGLHRITMLLQPEALGEVRVTLTVRDGEVLVRLAAGDDAQRALLEGAPELRRVLELAGASDARVVVRDLPHTPGSQQGLGQSAERFTNPDSAGAFSNGDTNASGHGRGDEQDQHARTRGGSTARDGLTDGANQLRPDPAVDASRGVDLTM